MLMFEFKQSEVPAENQLQGARDGCPATLSPGPGLEGGFWAAVTHPLASGSSTVGTPRLTDILLKFRFHDVSPMVVVQSLSRVQLFATPMDYSTPGLPVHHQFPEPAQTHVH